MKIKDCPHCNGGGSLRQSYNRKEAVFFVYVRCDKCGAVGSKYICDEEPAATNWNNQACKDAIAAWNMRNGKIDAENRL